MRSEQLSRLVDKVDGLHGAAWSAVDGTVHAESAGFDADVPCAVAAICQSQLEELGQRLGAGPVQDWAVTASQANLYVIRKGESSIVALGAQDEKPTKVVENIAKALDGFSVARR